MSEKARRRAASPSGWMPVEAVDDRCTSLKPGSSVKASSSQRRANCATPSAFIKGAGADSFESQRCRAQAVSCAARSTAQGVGPILGLGTRGGGWGLRPSRQAGRRSDSKAPSASRRSARLGHSDPLDPFGGAVAGAFSIDMPRSSPGARARGVGARRQTLSGAMPVCSSGAAGRAPERSGRPA